MSTCTDDIRLKKFDIIEFHVVDSILMEYETVAIGRPVGNWSGMTKLTNSLVDGQTNPKNSGGQEQE